MPEKFGNNQETQSRLHTNAVYTESEENINGRSRRRIDWVAGIFEGTKGDVGECVNKVYLVVSLSSILQSTHLSQCHTCHLDMGT